MQRKAPYSLMRGQWASGAGRSGSCRSRHRFWPVGRVPTARTVCRLQSPAPAIRGRLYGVHGGRLQHRREAVLGRPLGAVLGIGIGQAAALHAGLLAPLVHRRLGQPFLRRPLSTFRWLHWRTALIWVIHKDCFAKLRKYRCTFSDALMYASRVSTKRPMFSSVSSTNSYPSD